MKNYKFRASPRGADFLARYSREEITAFASLPRSEDDRTRPAFFTGHIDLNNELFSLMPGRYVTVAVLRDPVERVISHYRFNSTQPSVFQTAIQSERLSVLDYHQRFASAIGTQLEIFGSIEGLKSKVSYFGIASRYEEFAATLSALLGFSTTVHKTLNRTSSDAISVSREDEAELRKFLVDDIAFHEQAVSLYRERLPAIPFSHEHEWTKFYS